MSCVFSIVFCIATVSVLSVNCMVADTEPDEEAAKDGPLPMSHLKFLARNVCYDLQLLLEPLKEIDKKTDCEDNFTNSTRDVTPDPSELQLICRSKTSAKYEMQPTKELQLVILVPETGTKDIGTSILKASHRTGAVSYLSNDYSYTFWTTTLHHDGSHCEWRKGPELSPWNANNINFTTEEPSLEYIEKDQEFKAIFKINIVGEINSCTAFNIRNVCYKDDLGWPEEKTIRPNVTANQTQIVWPIRKLPINDSCSLKIYTHDNLETPKFEKKYWTPIPNNTLLPEKFENVTLVEVPIASGWDIHVNWARPERIPNWYNLILQAPGMARNVTLSGVETSYVFKDVLGKEAALYKVIIKGFYQDEPTISTAMGQFPLRRNFLAVIITGSWSVVLTVAAAIIGALVWWRRRKMIMNRKSYFTPPELKLPKECLIESCPESGVEDGWELRSERLLLHEVIGEGAFGVVRRGTLTPAGREVAVKMLKDFPTLEEIRSFRAEMELMKSVGAHPHIVSLVGCCSGRRPLIVAEYCSRGDLLSFLRCSWDVMVSKRNAKYYNNNLEGSDYRNDLLKEQKDSKFSPLVVNKLYDLQGLCDSELTPLDLLSFCRQIAMGMEFLASNRVVHRDLAARNVLVTRDRTLKIADFGLSRDVYQENQYKQKGNGKMPVKWMALESLTHRIYTTQSDVWSFGVVIWEVVTVGGAPYPEVAAARLPRLLRAGYRMPRPNNCSKQLYDLMMSCWRARPRERPTFADLHRQLDELLNNACADEYLSLELDNDQPPTPKPQRYIRMILRGNRVWARGESYERPLKGPQSNHYTTTPHAANTYQPTNCLKSS